MLLSFLSYLAGTKTYPKIIPPAHPTRIRWQSALEETNDAREKQLLTVHNACQSSAGKKLLYSSQLELKTQWPLPTRCVPSPPICTLKVNWHEILTYSHYSLHYCYFACVSIFEPKTEKSKQSGGKAEDHCSIFKVLFIGPGISLQHCSLIIILSIKTVLFGLEICTRLMMFYQLIM